MSTEDLALKVFLLILYFEELLNRQTGDERETRFKTDQCDIKEENHEPPTVDEISDAITKLRNRKASSEDAISAEHLQSGGETLVQMLYDLIPEIWDNETMTNEWNSAIIFPKGEYLKLPSGIALLNVTYKLFARIITKSLQPYILIVSLLIRLSRNMLIVGLGDTSLSMI